MKASYNQIRTALDAPPADTRFYLLHGPDEAGARELAARLARALGGTAERVDLDPGTLRSDPARLADEAASIGLFGDARYIRIDGMGEEGVEAVQTLLDIPVAGNPVIAIAPGVKGSGRLAKLVLAAPNALAYPCYLPDGEAAERIASQVARDLGMRMNAGSAARLAAAAGGDRAVMTRELEKLAAYLDAAPDRPRDLDEAALDAVGADLGESQLGATVDAAIDGRVADLSVELARLEEVGTSPIPLLRQITRRLMALAEMRADIDAGGAPAAVIEKHRVFFKDRQPTQRALRRWPAAKLAEAIGRARAGERAIMSPGNAGIVMAQAALIGIARMAARLG